MSNVKEWDLRAVKEKREKGRLVGTCSVKVDQAVLDIPCSNWAAVVPVVGPVQRETKISCLIRKVCRVPIAQSGSGAGETARVAEIAVASGHPVNELQRLRACHYSGCRGDGTERIRFEETVVYATQGVERSEEHTSELQSLTNL